MRDSPVRAGPSPCWPQLWTLACDRSLMGRGHHQQESTSRASTGTALLPQETEVE